MAGSRGARRLLTLLLVLAALVWLVPIVWMLSLALQPNDLLARTTSNVAWGLVPWPFTLDNLTFVLSQGLTPRWFLNSAIVAVSMTLLVLALSSMAGYAFARIRFPGRRIIYPLVLAGLVIPEQAVFIPLYTMFADWAGTTATPRWWRRDWRCRSASS